MDPFSYCESSGLY